MDKQTKKFKFPTSVLHQINECSNGFFLVTLNQNNEFEVFQNLESPVHFMSMATFLRVASEQMFKSVTSSHNEVEGEEL